MTRRKALEFLAAGASAAAAQTSPSDIDAIVKNHDHAVDGLLSRQITDSKSRGYGSLPAHDAVSADIGLYSANSAASLVASYTAAYLHPSSKFHGDNLLIERIRLAIGFLNRVQHADGFIDLLETNFDSPPDTGFTVHNLATAACLAQRAGNRELVGLSEPFLRKAAGGLAIGGIHTPNHRWVVSSALAQINEIFPDPRYLHRIDQWLGEGIDIDDDGQWTERSTSVYNTVCDRAFVVLAAKLKRPELLDPVRRNLNAMLYLMHPDYEVVTEISNRQDRNQRGTMGGYWFPLRYLAMRDQNGQFATIANHFTPANASLPAMMEYPEIAGPLPAPEPVPTEYSKPLPHLGVVRFRSGALSSTVLWDNPTFFTFRNGSAVIDAVRFASAFFGKGQFAGSKLEAAGDRLVLSQTLEGPYYQPLDPPRRVTPASWGSVRRDRATSQVCHLTQTAHLTQTKSGSQIRFQADGFAGVPLAIEITFRDTGRIEGGERLTPETYLLNSPTATYKTGTDTIRFGPGLSEHRYTQVRGALPRIPGQTVYLTGFTPLDHTVTFEAV